MSAKLQPLLDPTPERQILLDIRQIERDMWEASDAWRDDEFHRLTSLLRHIKSQADAALAKTEELIKERNQ